MSKPTLGMICPSRGRPQSVRRMAKAWEVTRAWGVVPLIWALDGDDPAYDEYISEIDHGFGLEAHYHTSPQWQPMVPKLNRVAVDAVGAFGFGAVGFLGDDHVPRTDGWVFSLAADIIFSGPCILYGRDGFQDIKLPTWWVMSSSIIQALGRMVPADVQHMYCDNAVMTLGVETGTLRYLPDVLIEHMHPVAGKAEMDEGYHRVNRRQQYERDRVQFDAWLGSGLARDAKIVSALRT